MTMKVLKSQVDQVNGFDVKVATHAAEMKNWRAHMALVQEDKGRNDIEPIDRHWPIQRPDPHPLVAAAVNENDESDYEIVDDSATPDQVLRVKKDRLIDIVSAAEEAAVLTIIPRGRARQYWIREKEIADNDDAAKAALLGAPTFLKGVKTAIGFGPKLDDINAEVARRRAPEDTVHLEEQRQRRSAVDAIRKVGAKAHNEIEDLTADTIDSWEMPDFKS